jgi:hypothetical protein
MSKNDYQEEQASGTKPDAPISGSRSAGDRPMSFDCCSSMMGEEMGECPCASAMRRHPFITAAVVTFMGLALLLVPAGAILGIVAFFRTF